MTERMESGVLDVRFHILTQCLAQVANHLIALRVKRECCFFISLTNPFPLSYTPLAPRLQNEESHTTKLEHQLALGDLA